jgi:hypothetical protein
LLVAPRALAAAPQRAHVAHHARKLDHEAANVDDFLGESVALSVPRLGVGGGLRAQRLQLHAQLAVLARQRAELDGALARALALVELIGRQQPVADSHQLLLARRSGAATRRPHNRRPLT